MEFEVIEYAPLSNRAMNRVYVNPLLSIFALTLLLSHTSTLIQKNIAPQKSLKTSFCTAESDRELGMDTWVAPCHDIYDVTKNFELKISAVLNFSNNILHATNKFYASDVDGGQISLFVVCGLYPFFPFIARGGGRREIFLNVKNKMHLNFTPQVLWR